MQIVQAIPSDGRPSLHPLAGVRAEHTWVGEWTKGLESIVTTTFEPKDGGTFITLRHTGVPDDEEGRQSLQGWIWCLSMLAEKWSSKKSG